MRFAQESVGKGVPFAGASVFRRHGRACPHHGATSDERSMRQYPIGGARPSREITASYNQSSRKLVFALRRQTRRVVQTRCAAAPIIKQLEKTCLPGSLGKRWWPPETLAPTKRSANGSIGTGCGCSI